MNTETPPSPHSQPPRRRTRPAKSCTACRKRKIACDKKLPCSSCVRSRVPSDCYYRPERGTPGDSAGNDGNRVLTPRPAVPAAPEGRTQQARPTPLLPKGPGSGQRQEVMVEELQQRIRHLEELLSRKQPENHQPALQADTEHRILPRPSSPLPPLRLRSSSSKTRFFGPSHWHYIADQFSILKFDADAEPSAIEDRAELGTLMADAKRLRHRVKAHSLTLVDQPVPNLVATLPSRETCDALLDCYLRTFESIYRIIHVPSIRKTYNACWDQQNFSSAPAHFQMKLVLMLAIGTAFYKPNDKDELGGLRDKAHTWMYAAQWWLTGPTERTAQTLDGLQVCCLLMVARQTIQNSPGVSGWISSGSLISMSMILGLQRNPEHFKNIIPFEKEMRRRLWTTVLELSLLHSLDLTTPLPLHLDDFGIYLPSNLDDDDIDPKMEAIPTARTGLTDCSLQLLLSKTMSLRMNIIRKLHSLHTELQYGSALKLGEELLTACRGIAAFFQADNLTNRGGLQISKFHLKLLDIYVRKYLLSLYTPFMLRARKDPRFDFTRKACVESAFVVASHAKDMDFAAPHTEPDDFARLSIMGRGLFKGPMGNDVINILCLEVITQLVDTGPLQLASDPLNELYRAGRAPIVSALETILDRLTQIRAHGNIGLMRIGFLTSFMAQVKALEERVSVSGAVVNVMADRLREWNDGTRKILEQMSLRSAASGISNDGDAQDWNLGGEMQHSFDMDWGFLDPHPSWDLSAWDLPGN